MESFGFVKDYIGGRRTRCFAYNNEATGLLFVQLLDEKFIVCYHTLDNRAIGKYDYVKVRASFSVRRPGELV